jgi:hypothetical protein
MSQGVRSCVRSSDAMVALARQTSAAAVGLATGNGCRIRNVVRTACMYLHANDRKERKKDGTYDSTSESSVSRLLATLLWSGRDS